MSYVDIINNKIKESRYIKATSKGFIKFNYYVGDHVAIRCNLRNFGEEKYKIYLYNYDLSELISESDKERIYQAAQDRNLELGGRSLKWERVNVLEELKYRFISLARKVKL